MKNPLHKISIKSINDRKVIIFESRCYNKYVKKQPVKIISGFV